MLPIQSQFYRVENLVMVPARIFPIQSSFLFTLQNQCDVLQYIMPLSHQAYFLGNLYMIPCWENKVRLPNFIYVHIPTLCMNILLNLSLDMLKHFPQAVIITWKWSHPFDVKFPMDIIWWRFFTSLTTLIKKS